MNKNKQISSLVKGLINVYNQNDDIDNKKIALTVIKVLINENLKRMRKND